MSKRIPPRPAQTKRKSAKPKPVQQPPRLLSATGSGYVQDAKYALGADSQHPTPIENLVGADEEVQAHEPEPEAVDEETQQWITAESKNRQAVIHAEEMRRREVRSLAAQVREVGSLALKLDMDLPELDRIRSELEAARKRLRKAA